MYIKERYKELKIATRPEDIRNDHSSLQQQPLSLPEKHN